MKDLIEDYKKKKGSIKKRLRYFKEVNKQSDKDLFAELCFCILTPQAKAIICDEAVNNLKKAGALYRGSRRDIRPYLKGVRFPNNKSKYIVATRSFFRNGGDLDIKGKLDPKDPFKTRDWLVKNVRGLGYKEASHFLRNIGLGEGLAILDRHILKNLKRYGVIKKIPDSLNRKEYLNIEKRMKEFFGKINIPIEEADLLFWSRETGFIFK